MILCEWDASEGHPGQSCVHLFARILSTSFISVSIFSVWCYSSVFISMVSANEYSCAQSTWSPNKLWRSNSIFHLWYITSEVKFLCNSKRSYDFLIRIPHLYIYLPDKSHSTVHRDRDEIGGVYLPSQLEHKTALCT
jgi:hypothetical protein